MDYMKTSFGMEAIAYQSKDRVFQDLTKLFQKLLDSDSSNYSRTISESGIEEYMLKEFGILHTLRVENYGSPNAYVIPPDMKKNHVLLTSHQNHFVNAKETLKYLKSSKLRVLQASVDRSSGKISGIFSKMDSQVVLTSGLLEGNFTAAEITAVYLHEIGHIWSYFECMALVASTNYALEAVAQALKGTNDVQLNVALIAAVGDVTGTDLRDIYPVAESRIDNELQLVVVNEVYKKRISNTENGNLYDTTGWEFQADQFVGRLGGSKHLATALTRITRSWAEPAYMNTALWLFLQIFSVTGALLGPVIIPLAIFALYLLTGIHPEESTYDKPKERLRRMELELRGSLKYANLSKERILQTLADLEVIGKLVDEAQSRTWWMDQFRVFMWRPWARQKNELKYQKLLEELSNSELTVTAAKFKTANFN